MIDMRTVQISTRIENGFWIVDVRREFREQQMPNSETPAVTYSYKHPIDDLRFNTGRFGGWLNGVFKEKLPMTYSVKP